VACAAPYAVGGAGLHLAAIVEEARAAGSLVRYLSPRCRPGDAAGLDVVPRALPALTRRLPFGWRETLPGLRFDAAVAQRLEAAGPAETFRGFAGQALRSMRAARRLGFERLVLESATSHVDHVRERHAVATSRYPIEPSWLSGWARRRTLAEYTLADEIVVCSDYAAETFVRAGVDPAKLRRRHLTAAPRFAPPERPAERDGFCIVYSGRLQVTKGVPVLLDALAQIPDRDVRVVLVGGTGTAAMDRYLHERRRQDERIVLASGDPLPHLHRADLLVHPSFEDGFGFAPCEALAAGVPVVVTEDTGMKEHVTEGRNGRVVPTGDVASLVAALAAMRG
jgi:glycosyltransferase involved in cell wall biosynthesis